MKIALIGATGYTGRPALGEALARGHEVTAIARRAQDIAPRDNLTVRAADILEPDVVAEVVAGHDLVISCFNPNGRDASKDPAIYRDIVEGTRLMIDGVKAAGLDRLIYVGGVGSLLAPSGKLSVDDLGYFGDHLQNLPPGALDADGPFVLDIPLGVRIAYYLFEREDTLKWSFISPSMFLGDFGGRTGNLRWGTTRILLEDDDVPSRLDVEDLAVALIDEAENPRYGHLTVASVL
ncbi:NAD(P)-dependent oxidoreductase [Nocardioides hungaricus]